MKKLLLLLLAGLSLPFQAQNVSQYVNPFIGTQSMGHTFPGACVPHGLVQLSPDTDTIPHNVNGKYQKDAYKYCAGYQYTDSTIVGFSHTHFNGTGHSDLGDILLMPTTGAIQLNPGTRDDVTSGYRSSFSHDNEAATPGFYSVLLDKYQIKAELTATERVGVHKYSFPKGKGNVIIDLNHGIYNYEGKTLWSGIRVENDTLITGFRYTNGWARFNQIYFAVSFSRPIAEYGGKDLSKQTVYQGFLRKFDINHNFPDMQGRKLKSYFTFDLSDGLPLIVKVALSAVDREGAIKNLNAEAGGKSFDTLLAEAKDKWETSLSKIQITGTQAVKENFYTSLYHTLINPSVYEDVDGRYRGLDHSIHQADGFMNYTVFSLWDTFRALHPLYNLLYPKKSADMMTTLQAHADQNVHKVLPVWSHMGNENWCMIGYHGVSLLADAASKSVNIDKQKALDAMFRSSQLKYYDGIDEYTKLGYVPLEKDYSSASITLEYAYDDWCIYQMCLRAGNNEMAEAYRQRAMSYRNLFNPESGYVQPRYADGRWKDNFDIYNTHGQGFIEGNSLNYSFFVPHDVKGMITSMGGEATFVKRLDELFTVELDDKYFSQTEDVTREGILGSYVHGNEPSHHIPYLYMWTSQPWKTAQQVRRITQVMYKNKIDGLCGNDDCGQMSAWYVFSSLGFYPVCPGSDQYIIGSPTVNTAVVTLENNRKLNIKVSNQSDRNCYIQKIYWNGKPYRKTYFRHSDLMAGGELRFVMDSKPAKNWFSRTELPYSLSNQEAYRIIPAVQHQSLRQGELSLANGYRLEFAPELENEAKMFRQYMAADFGLKESVNGAIVRLVLKSGKDLKEGEYNIDVDHQITVSSASALGIFYGIQSLRQLVRKTGAQQLYLPLVSVHDYPTFKWRAFMLDESRAFKGKEIVKGLLDEMARLKLNIFHWHLTDDHGWRIEIKKYPELCKIGSRRDSTQIGGWRGTTYDGVPHEGYYTQDEIREIIDYAHARHIKVVPEIEMPGHSSAAIAAYPYLGATKRQIKVPCRFGVQYELLDVSSEKVDQFLKDVLEEVIALFPSEVIHIGGDEVKYDQWKASESVQQYMKQHQIKTPADLQIHFTNSVSSWLKGKGKRMMGWNDITGNKIHEYNDETDAVATTSKLAEGTIVQFWKGDIDLIEQTAEKGYDIVNSYHYGTYLDYNKKRIPLEKAYLFNPVPEGLDAKLEPRILGLGCQMWGEEIMEDAKMYHMIYPRIAAYAECGWTSQQRKDFSSFLESLYYLGNFNNKYRNGER